MLLSAGIGATPVLAMLHALAAASSPREVWWLHGARDGGEHPFAEEVRALLEALPGGHSHIRYSAPGPADRPGVDFDAAGRLSVHVLTDPGRAARCRFLYVRPAGLHDRYDRGLAAGRPGRSHPYRDFRRGTVADARHRRGPQKPPIRRRARGLGTAGVLRAQRPQRPWGPAFQSLLELAEACDVPVRWSCRTGVCHTCETGHRAGAVAYQPDPVNPPADGNVLICCCRPEATS